MNNRLPIYILAALVLVALIWRIANPPPAPLPGPRGRIPTWNSMFKIGDMRASGVNPAGTIWAGAWTEKTKDALTTALVIIDLEKKTSQHVQISKKYAAQSLFWRDDKSFRVLLTNDVDAQSATKAQLATCTVGNAKTRCEKSELIKPVVSILDWPVGSDVFIARPQGEPKVVLMDQKGNDRGEEASLDAPKSAGFFPVAAVSPDGGSYVVGVEKSDVGGMETFYLVDNKAGTAKELFASSEVPGIIQGMWLSPSGLLIVASEQNKFHEVVYDPATKKMTEIKGKGAVDVAKSWPDAPATMMFTTFDGGYQLNLADGKAKRLFEFEADRTTSMWRKEVQGGRLYPRKDGDYTSISYAAGAVDIRVIGKDGASEQPILRRR